MDVLIGECGPVFGVDAQLLMPTAYGDMTGKQRVPINYSWMIA